MNNFFGKLSYMKDALMSNMKDTFMSKSGNIMNNVRKSVGLLTAATALSMGSGAMAGEWYTVDTKGIGPEAFAMQKFGNKEWKLLVDDQGRNVLKPDKDLQYRGKYTQKPVASGQGDDTARSAARVISTPRPQPHKEARANQISIGENSTGQIKKNNLAQTNSLTGPKKDPIPTNELKVPENFDLDAFIAQKMAEQSGSQDTHPKSEGRKNEELLCENPDFDKNSKIIKEVSQLDLGTLIAIPPKETSPKTQMGPKFPGKVISIEQARAMRKPLENITAKESSEKPTVVEENGGLKKLFSLAYGKYMGLNFYAYKKTIAQIESGKKGYTARNDAIGRKMGVKDDKFAFGFAQITVGTFRGLGIDLKKNGKISEERVKALLNNHDAQDKAFTQYTEQSFEVVKNNKKLLGLVENGKISLPAVLARLHIAGHGSFGKDNKLKDWLGKSVPIYGKESEKLYFSFTEEERLTDTTTSKSTNSKKSIPTIQAIQPEINIPTPIIQESKDTINKPAIQATGQNNQKTSSLILAPKPENIINTAPSANDTIFATQQVTQSVISLIDEKRIQVNKLMEIEQSHLESAKVHRMEATRLRKEAINRFGNNWELSRRRLNKQAETHESNAEAHENRANALNNTIMRMTNNQPLEKAA